MTVALVRVQLAGKLPDATQVAPVGNVIVTLREIRTQTAVELQSPVPDGIVVGLSGLHTLNVWSAGAVDGIGGGNVGIVPPITNGFIRRIVVILPVDGA